MYSGYRRLIGKKDLIDSRIYLSRKQPQKRALTPLASRSTKEIHGRYYNYYNPL